MKPLNLRRSFPGERNKLIVGRHPSLSARAEAGTSGTRVACVWRCRFTVVALTLSVAACEDGKPRLTSIEDPASYRPLRAEDQAGRAVFSAGLSLPVPPGARVTYPQGIDSRIMHIDGPGYTLQLDDYGAFAGPAATTLAGAPATVEDQRERGCRFRIWRVQLPGTSPTKVICAPGNASNRKQAPAQATIATFCTSKAACRQVNAILAGTQFRPKPWPIVPLPDPSLRPQEPACRPG